MNHRRKDSISYRDFHDAAASPPMIVGPHHPEKFGGFEWLQEESNGILINPVCTVEQLSQRPACPIRIVFAPLDLPLAERVDDLLALYKLYSVPAGFVSERLANVACAFGSSQGEDGSRYCWLHFLCKNITVREANGVKDIINENTRPNSKVISQADFSWIRSAYCMKIQPPNETISWPQVTLLVFGQVGKVDEVFNKFDALSSYTPATAILKDPYCLFDVIFEVLYTRIDGLAWSLADVYGQKEEGILIGADQPVLAAAELDFVGLHMLSKHQIYLVEAAEALMATLDSLDAYYERVLKSFPYLSSATDFENQTQAAFRYRKTLLKSTYLRLKSLEKRTQNMINLSFNLVAQADSKLMKADSSSMKTIAAMTLLFLPFTAVATVFSTPFFYLYGDTGDNPNGNTLGMSSYFWLIWAISLPITLLVILIFYLYQKRIASQVIEPNKPFENGKRSLSASSDSLDGIQMHSLRRLNPFARRYSARDCN